MAPATTATNGTGLMMPEMTHGWVHQPNGRGTLDIVLSCLTTIFLCSWSVLSLNIPAEEMITGIAAEQWRSASQSVEDFSNLKKEWQEVCQQIPSASILPAIQKKLARIEKTPWTMRHAFFADMGGFHLECHDFAPFPVDAHQINYLVKNNYMEYPAVTEEVIGDKNKADSFARVITLGQILWFFLQRIGRVSQKLALSTIELSTLAFIFCTVNTFFFWYHKPLDVETVIVLSLSSNTKMGDILHNAGDQARNPYSCSPLDFINPPKSRFSLIAPFWFGVNVVFFWDKKYTPGPSLLRRFGNSQRTPPRGIKWSDTAFALVFTVAYVGIHLAGWNFTFPSDAERILWRACSLTLLGLLVYYLFGVGVGTLCAGRIARILFKNDKETTILGIAGLLPRRAALLVHLPIFFFYGLARIYIILEGFINLRALPASAFESVNWSEYLPHY